MLAALVPRFADIQEKSWLNENVGTAYAIRPSRQRKRGRQSRPLRKNSGVAASKQATDKQRSRGIQLCDVLK